MSTTRKAAQKGAKVEEKKKESASRGDAAKEAATAAAQRKTASAAATALIRAKALAAASASSKTASASSKTTSASSKTTSSSASASACKPTSSTSSASSAPFSTSFAPSSATQRGNQAQRTKRERDEERVEEEEEEEEEESAAIAKYDLPSETPADAAVREECEAARYAVALWCASCFAPSKTRVKAEECYVRDSIRERLVGAIEKSVSRENATKQAQLELDSVFHASVIESVLFWRWYYLHPAMYRQRCRQIEFNLTQNGWYMLTHFGPLTICAFPTRKLAENTTVEQWRAEHRRHLLHDLKPPTPKVDEKGLFQCGKCKSWRTTYYPLQTRGGDESMTNFVTCHDCNNHFRKS